LVGENSATEKAVPAPVDDVPVPLAYDRRIARRGAWMRVGLFGLALLGAILIGHVVALPKATLCTFQILFDRPCPGCGMTRSIQSLAQGDLLTSLRFHPLGIALFGGSVAGFLGGIAYLVRGRDPFWEFLERRGTFIAVGLLVGMIGVWIVRGFAIPEWSPDPIGQRTRPALTPSTSPSGG
jgi:hypothetical protein